MTARHFPIAVYIPFKRRSLGLLLNILTLFLLVPSVMAESSGFQFSLKSVFEENAEKYIVEKSNIRRFHEIFGPHQSYWAAAANDIPARLTFRFPLERPLKSGRLYTDLLTADFEKNRKLGFGKGSGSLWCSRDGQSWIRLLDTREETGKALTLVTYNDPLPKELSGTQEVWIQVRLFATGMRDGTYSVAQFARKRVDDPHSRVFDLRVKYDQPSASPASIQKNGIQK